ncbi:MAG TPA: porin [Candidatus Coprenecus stercoravium]|uniref:Porin n=1 Tax=Candidatus Coprenecus stercoravium TaxID=2840735 RepID=A0A9D2GRV5_9BACT|nr:porin [Candidatus Coprenecus stercoravium]
MNIKATVISIILTAAACTSASAAADSLSTGSKESKGGKLMNFLSEKVSVSGYAQAGYQYGTYDMEHDGAFNKFNLYRAMITADVKPIKHLDLYFMADVSKFKLHELFIRYRPVDAFYIRLGQYKTPFTIESNMSPSVLEIIKGAQAVQYLAGIDGSDVCFGAGSGRDLGLEAGGEFLKVGKDRRNLFEYRVGVFNGEPSNTAESNNRKDVVASLAIRPVSMLKLHGSVYIGEGTAKTDSPYGSFKAGETYRRNRWSAGLELKAGPIYLRSEYMEGLDASVRSRGAYATLTGSPVKFLDIVASVDYLDRNISLSDWQCNYIIGLQWNIYRKCRLQAQYVYQQRSADSQGIYSGVPSSHMFVTQLQVGF